MKAPSVVDEKTILSLLDVSGSCIVDIIYNHIYDRAIAIHEKTGKGLTDCYKSSLNDYVAERDNPRFYTVLLNSIHHYTRMSTVYGDISYPDCVNLYSSLFIPHMYHTSLTSDQKINILTMILGDSISCFVQEILRNHLSCIIDDHNDPINVEILQDAILKILLHKRDKNYERFIESQKATPQPPKTASKKDAVKSEAITKLTSAFKKSVNERMMLKKKNSALFKKNKTLTSKLQELKTLFLSQLAVQKQQASIITKLQENGNDKQQTVDVEPQQAEDEEDDDQLFSVEYIET